MRFDYQKYPVRRIGAVRTMMVWRPVIPIQVRGPAGDDELWGLVDSGSDETLLPGLLISKLGIVIALEERAAIGGIVGGRLTAPFGTVDFELRKGNRAYRWSAKVGFHDGFHTILGQAGFLRHFTATLDGLRNRVELKSNGTFRAPAWP
jgi:hypothetical protein